MPTDPPPVRPYLCDRVHAALVKAGRPVTRSELRLFMINGTGPRVAHIQDALDLLVAEGLAARGESPGRVPWRTFVVYRATDGGRS